MLIYSSALFTNAVRHPGSDRSRDLVGNNQVSVHAHRRARYQQACVHAVEKAEKREDKQDTISLEPTSRLFKGVKTNTKVLLTHGDAVKK